MCLYRAARIFLFPDGGRDRQLQFSPGQQQQIEAIQFPFAISIYYCCCRRRGVSSSRSGRCRSVHLSSLRNEICSGNGPRSTGGGGGIGSYKILIFLLGFLDAQLPNGSMQSDIRRALFQINSTKYQEATDDINSHAEFKRVIREIRGRR